MQDFNISFWKEFNDIFFDPIKHKYTDSIGTEYVSVTSFVSKFHEQFDAEGVAKKKAAKEGRDYRQILLEWREKGEYSTTLGTEVHAVMENMWQHKSYFPVFKKFIEKSIQSDFDNRREKCLKLYASLSKRFIPVREELIVYDKDLKLCGTIDFLAYDTSKDEYVIFDYKTNNEIESNPNQWSKKMFVPFDKYWALNYYEYSLQLSLYKYILLKHLPDMKLESMFLLHIPGNEEKVRSYKCLDMKNEIEDYFQNIRK